MHELCELHKLDNVHKVYNSMCTITRAMNTRPFFSPFCIIREKNKNGLGTRLMRILHRRLISRAYRLAPETINQIKHQIRTCTTGNIALAPVL